MTLLSPFLQARAAHLAEQYRKLLQELHVTATSSWRGSVKSATNDAIAQHKKHHAGDTSAAAAEDGAVPPAAAAAELKESEREQLFRQYVAELSKSGARCVVWACKLGGGPVWLLWCVGVCMHVIWRVEGVSL